MIIKFRPRIYEKEFLFAFMLPGLMQTSLLINMFQYIFCNLKIATFFSTLNEVK